MKEDGWKYENPPEWIICEINQTPPNEWEEMLASHQDIGEYQPIFTAETIQQGMQIIFNEMLENAQWTEEQDDAVAEFKNRLEEEIRGIVQKTESEGENNG